MAKVITLRLSGEARTLEEAYEKVGSATGPTSDGRPKPTNSLHNLVSEEMNAAAIEATPALWGAVRRMARIALDEGTASRDAISAAKALLKLMERLAQASSQAASATTATTLADDSDEKKADAVFTRGFVQEFNSPTTVNVHPAGRATELVVNGGVQGSGNRASVEANPCALPEGAYTFIVLSRDLGSAPWEAEHRAIRGLRGWLGLILPAAFFLRRKFDLAPALGGVWHPLSYVTSAAPT